MGGEPAMTTRSDLRRAVDEVLDPAWPVERRRAIRRMVASTVGRWAGGMAAITVLDLLLYVVVGVTLPPAFFVVVGLLAAVGALPDVDDRAHLSRWPRRLRRRPYLLPRP